ncbi:ADP-L-glycero-D-manno-heptose-6-epimerase [Paractinoplanes rishiriensis]|uniref:ADP-L-glycero-D-manno-heptose-6-epimerase n=1 Tax=Paractinoplanes rishiriensis TaxID=1050105 RepID=A0A919K853_9ACTN|nr:ADP-L-glycero-D-manno-heptose-6-epimerase [Actinoplanes rishiriensis]
MLVTGAAGFVGSHIVSGLVARGAAVVGVDVRAAPAHLCPAMKFHCEDFADDSVLGMVEAGHFDAVVHQAAISSTLEDDGDLLRDVNVDRPMRLAQRCAVAGIPFVYASSSSVYGRIHHKGPITENSVDDRALCSGPLNAYARSKLLFDSQLATRAPAGLHWVGLRYTNVFGTRERHKGPMASIISQLLRTVATNGTPTLFADTLDASRDYVPVQRVVEVLERVLEVPVPAGTYNVGSGCPVSFATLLRWCSEFTAAAGVNVRLVPNPIADRYQYWTCADPRKLQLATGLSALAVEDVRAAASDLFHAFESMPDA